MLSDVIVEVCAHKHAYIPYCFRCGTKYGNIQGLHSIALPSFVRVSLSLVSYMNVHIPIVLCCGVKRVLFTNKLSKCINTPYLFTKFYTSEHLGKRVTQTCIFTLFFVVVRKGYCLPASYQNISVISLIPTCLPSFIHLSI